MASIKARESQYEYTSNSNLVLTADRSLIDVRRRDESTGEVKSLTGNLTGIHMGDKYQRSRAPEDLPAKRPKHEYTSDHSIQLDEPLFSGEEVSSFLSVPQSKTHFEFLLNFVRRFIGDQPKDVLIGAAEEIILTISDTKLSSSDKNNEIVSLLGEISSKHYNELSNLIVKLVSFSEKGLGRGNICDKDEMETNSSINVLFFEDSADDCSDNHEVRDDIDTDHDSGEEAYLNSDILVTGLPDPLDLKEFDSKLMLTGYSVKSILFVVMLKIPSVLLKMFFQY